MTKRILLMALLALALPLGAFAGTIDLSNTGGTLAGTSAGLTLTSSVLSEISIPGTPSTILASGDVGTVSFTSGAFVGCLTTGGTFGNGTFTITGNGSWGPAEVLFSGTFTNIKLIPEGGGTYEITGTVTGSWYNSTAIISGGTGQTISRLEFKDGHFTGTLGSGNTLIPAAVPEPGTLGLLGTGLVGLAGIVHKKLKT